MEPYRNLKCYCTIIVITFIVVVLYCYNPTDYVWMPKCPVKLFFGLDCPGCGFQRALHALLHGKIKEAYNYNPFLFYAGPYALSFFFCKIIPNQTVRFRIEVFLEGKFMTRLYLVSFFLWFIIRNL